jgi:hypothetical protein
LISGDVKDRVSQESDKRSVIKIGETLLYMMAVLDVRAATNSLIWEGTSTSTFLVFMTETSSKR